MLFVLFLFSAFASPLEEGDKLWTFPTYHLAIEKWKEAKNSLDEGISIMARYRLLLVSSNITFPFDLMRADRALMACDIEDPMCLLARIDREIIFRTLGYPFDQDLCNELITIIEPILPEQAQQRKAWLTHNVQTSKSTTIPNGPIIQGPGGPSISVGLFYGRLVGIGARLGYKIPNIDHKLADLYLYVSAGAINYGILGFQYDLKTPLWIQTKADIRQVNYFQYIDNEWDSASISSTQEAITFGYQKGDNLAWIGPQFRWEELENPIDAHGFTMGFQLGPESMRFSETLETSLTSYTHIRSTTLFQYKHPIGWGIQLRADLCPYTEAPWYRYPSAGGGLYLRLPFAQQIRHTKLYTAATEWKFFTKKLIGAAIFAEGAYGRDLYMGSGVGVRLRLPPSMKNTLRLDVGYSSYGWGFYVDIGEQF